MDVADKEALPGVIPASLAWLSGVLLVQWAPVLPSGVDLFLLAGLLVLLACLLWHVGRWALPGIAMAGMAWAVLHGAAAMSARLPRALEGKDITVVGRVMDLPDAGSDAVRFGFRIDSARLDGTPLPLRGLTRVAWYDDAAGVRPCETWRLRLRLRRPRGMLDPGGTDSERTALERGIIASGYVRSAPGNRRIRRAGPCMNALRARLAQGIDARVHDPHDAALLRAFALGDVRALEAQDWSVARANGVSHLLAISGFHVGVAAAFGVWLVRGLYFFWPGMGLRLPRRTSEALAASATATFYGALAGMGLPTLRTLLMIAVVVLACYRRRAIHAGHGLALALLVMLVVDPLAVLSAGFWLSFVGVAFLVLCLSTRWRGLRGFLKELVAGQAVMTLALLPLTLWFFGQASLVGALSNLVAVPVVSFVIVPLALLGVLALMACPLLAGPVFWVAARAIHAQWWLLAQVARWPGAQWYLPTVQPAALLSGLLGALWLLAPRGLPSRWFGALLFLPLLWPMQPVLPHASFRAWVFDVGQGLSVAVRTRRHTLVYDTGARYPSGFDVGAAAVVPSLHALGVRRLDALVVSHADNDHAGGAEAVLSAFPATRRLAGEPGRMPMAMDRCGAGQAWNWDGVAFRVLSPVGDGGRGNDRSCVILVDGGGDRLLLTGDISRRIEPSVAAAVPPGRSVVLVVPHHGSKTSSGTDFLAALRPSLALVSAGWHNRFGHPHPLVVARYTDAGIRLLNTASSGAVAVRFPARGHAWVEHRERLEMRRYWRER